MKSPSQSEFREAGFTRLDLIVVLLVLVVLALMILPALARTKTDSRVLRCLNNNRELNRAWRMWTDDNNDLLLFSSHNLPLSNPNNLRAWVISGLDFNPNNPGNWNPAVSLVPSPMWPYCGANASIWRCPSDGSYVVVNGELKPRVRSYSMNFYFGGFAGDTSAETTAYRFFFKASEMVSLSPERLFVFLDHRSDSIDWGNFLTQMEGYPSNPSQHRFSDLPGASHDGAAVISYADGHGEAHRWLDRRTTPPLVFNAVIVDSFNSPNNPDVAWLQERATRPK